MPTLENPTRRKCCGIVMLIGRSDPLELEDAGPLLYQLYWAIEDLERFKGGEA